jgi:hypothetical protein
VSCLEWSSNVTLVIRTEDNSLWAIGLGEYDRNFVCEPIPVQDVLNDDASQYSESSSGGVHTPPVVLPPGTKVVKGHKRVSLIYPKNARAKDGNGINALYDVILHEKEAFLQDVSDIEFENDQYQDATIVDYSAGWLHNLLVLETSEDVASSAK